MGVKDDKLSRDKHPSKHRLNAFFLLFLNGLVILYRLQLNRQRSFWSFALI